MPGNMICRKLASKLLNLVLNLIAGCLGVGLAMARVLYGTAADSGGRLPARKLNYEPTLYAALYERRTGPWAVSFRLFAKD